MLVGLHGVILLLLAIALLYFYNGAYLLLIMLFVSACVVLTFWLSWQQHIRLARPQSVQAVRRFSNGQWQLECTEKHADKTVVTVELSPRSFFIEWLVILNFTDSKQPHKNYSVIFTPFCVDESVFRQLKVMLKTQRFSNHS